MALSEEQLIVLDTLIYSGCVSNNLTVAEIADRIEAELNSGNTIKSARMSAQDWEKMINIVRNDDALKNYTVVNFDSEIMAACFVDNKDNPSDVNAIFRGTSNSYEWHDNGQGGYLSDTQMQAQALQYIEKLPDSLGYNITVSGHSKGGNKAQYVAILSSRVSRCVSVDGQGFSPEFIKAYHDEIIARRDHITSISASGDVVNSILFPIAGTAIFIDTDGFVNPIAYHNPSILLDEDGRLHYQTDRSCLSEFVLDYSCFLVNNLEQPAKQWAIDGLLSFFEGKNAEEGLIEKIFAGEVLIVGIPIYTLAKTQILLETEKRELSSVLESVAFPFAVVAFVLSTDIGKIKEMWPSVMIAANNVAERLQALGTGAIVIGCNFVKSINDFMGRLFASFKKSLSAGYSYIVGNTYIYADTSRMKQYEQRIARVNSRITSLHDRITALYGAEGLIDLKRIIQNNMLKSEIWRLKGCIRYLSETAADLDCIEREIRSWY